MGIGDIWNLVALQPMVNISIALSHYLAGSFGLTIIVLTIFIRLVTLPLTLKQLRATTAMQKLQPELAELRKKYARDKQKLAQEQMKMYRESGMNPAGCMVPMLVQMPVWIALYQAIMKVLAVTPEEFLGLSPYLYSWPVVYTSLPLGNSFLWLDLASPDSIILLPILVGGTMWVQQKMVTPTTTDPQQQAQSRMMLWMMPLMFAFMTLQFPSGLSLYWVISNIITIAIQYHIVGGWGDLLPKQEAEKPPRKNKFRKHIAEVEKSSSGDVSDTDVSSPRSTEEGSIDGKSGDKRKERGGGYQAGPPAIRRHTGRGGGNRPKRG